MGFARRPVSRLRGRPLGLVWAFRPQGVLMVFFEVTGGFCSGHVAIYRAFWGLADDLSRCGDCPRFELAWLWVLSI